MPPVFRAAVALSILLATTALGALENGGRRLPPVAADVTAVPATGPMVIDAEMSEAVWEQAPRITEFLQREPAEGVAPTFQTEARVAYDDDALYVAVRAFDPEPDRIVGILTRRDQQSPSDWVKVVVDSYNDRRSAYEFAVNPVGVKRDRYYYDDGPSDESWDAVWDVEVAKDADGWRAEFRIPFSQLRFAKTDGSPVGFAMIREIGRLNEISTWPLLSRSANGFVSQFGQVNGIIPGGAPARFEIMPYTLARVEMQTVEEGDPLTESPDPGGSLGLDLKYALRPGLTLTGTANPDFGQVEADPAVVNLDAAEVFFPERRPFFVEESGTFRFNMDCNDGACSGLFYSRRIGRAPQGEPEEEDDQFVKTPETATIISAAKVTGRVAGFSVGGLTALTAREDAIIATTGSIDTETMVVEPMTAYTVARLRREYQNQSALGFMLTSTNRAIVEDVTFLSDNALTGGLDYDWRLSKRYSVQGYWAGSHIQGGEEAIEQLQKNNVHAFQRPDADYLGVNPSATRLQGHAGSVSFGKIAGDRTRFNSVISYKSPGFDSNDLGFQRRADEKTVTNWFQLRDFVPGKYVRTWNLNFNQWSAWNFGGDQLYSGGNINTHWTFVNNYSFGVGFNFNAAPFRDRVTRGGPGVLGNQSLSLWYYGNTDNRVVLSMSYNGYHEADAFDSVRHNINPWINYRASSAISLSAGIRYEINRDDAQWVENEEYDNAPTNYVFGRIDQKTVAMTLRFNYTMTPNLSLQTYAEPFVSAGDYSNYRRLVDGRAKDYYARYEPYNYPGDANFNVRSFRTTNVLRWEFKPGSALFLVWQQGRRERLETFGNFDFTRDFSGVFSTPSKSVFLVKMSYWFNK